jgi:hypothetical protein
VIQAEFSHFNKNNILVLGTRGKQTCFQIIDLHESGMPVEIEYHLENMMPSGHIHGMNNKDLKFVGFTQSAPSAMNDMTPDIFQVHFLTESGHLYSLCPVIPRTSVLRE